jgi:hypothetical protein
MRLSAGKFQSSCKARFVADLVKVAGVIIMLKLEPALAFERIPNSQ